MIRVVLKYVWPPCVGVLAVLYGCQTATTHMGQNERLYLSKCSSCHRPVTPASRTASQWRELLQHHGPKLTDIERSAILTYLSGPERCT